MRISATKREQIGSHLRQIYQDRAESYLPRLLEMMDGYDDLARQRTGGRWDQRDIMLITYGDQLSDPDTGRSPLATMKDFLTEFDLARVINIVHLLPFFPHSSDDGFSVIDYRAVDPQLGSWDDIRQLHESADLMFDLVLNHVSQHSEWFRRYLAGEEPYRDFFIEVDPAADLSRVVRPRSLPLLTPFSTAKGKRHLWTTFSADQVDLNFAHPEVLLAMLDVLLFYVRQGARFIRFDAVAYLWKEIGTDCIHRPQTHAVIKLMRDVLDCVAPDVVLLTETNVPHTENVSYFGHGDQAHMVYQFSLPPLLLDALLWHDAQPFTRWLGGLDETPPGTTFFNFTASHDGVGVRPLEGLVAPERVAQLIQAVQERGGLVSTKRNPDGTDTPYELNISYLSALSDPAGLPPQTHVDRFLASQAVMLAMRGIPGIYFHSLVGTLNDLAAVQESGLARRINRRKFTLPELRQRLVEPGSLPARVFNGYRHLLETRIAQPAFHPDGAQMVCPTGHPSLVTFRRISPDQDQQILVVANLGEEACELNLEHVPFACSANDLLSGESTRAGRFRLKAYQVAWLTYSANTSTRTGGGRC